MPQTGTQHLSLFLSNVPAHSAQRLIPYFGTEALSVLNNYVNSLVKRERQFCSKKARYVAFTLKYRNDLLFSIHLRYVTDYR